MIMPKGKFGKAIEVLVWIAGSAHDTPSDARHQQRPGFCGQRLYLS